MDRKEAINILSLRRQNAIGTLGNLPREANYTAKNILVDEISAYDMAIEALQEKDHRCDNCSNGENAGVRIYCLLHTSFHRLDEYCSEWEEDNG